MRGPQRETQRERPLRKNLAAKKVVGNTTRQRRERRAEKERFRGKSRNLKNKA